MSGVSFLSRTDKPRHDTVYHKIFPTWAQWAARSTAGYWHIYAQRPRFDRISGEWEHQPTTWHATMATVCAVRKITYDERIRIEKQLFGLRNCMDAEATLVKVKHI